MVSPVHAIASDPTYKYKKGAPYTEEPLSPFIPPTQTERRPHAPHDKTRYSIRHEIHYIPRTSPDGLVVQRADWSVSSRLNEQSVHRTSGR